MKLRLCKLSFHRDVKIQSNGLVKTKRNGDQLILVEVGKTTSFGKEHWVGAVSADIDNIKLVKNNIEKLENFDNKERIEWFSKNYPKVRLIQIEAALLIDFMQSGVKDNVGQGPAVTIDSAVELKWNK